MRFSRSCNTKVAWLLLGSRRNEQSNVAGVYRRSEQRPAQLHRVLRRSPPKRDQRALDRVSGHAGRADHRHGALAAFEAIVTALEPFNGVIDDLLDSLPLGVIG
jgi:hypothetical protein